MTQDGERRAAVIDGIDRNSRIYVGDTLVRDSTNNTEGNCSAN